MICTCESTKINEKGIKIYMSWFHFAGYQTVERNVSHTDHTGFIITVDGWELSRPGSSGRLWDGAGVPIKSAVAR